MIDNKLDVNEYAYVKVGLPGEYRNGVMLISSYESNIISIMLYKCGGAGKSGPNWLILDDDSLRLGVWSTPPPLIDLKYYRLKYLGGAANAWRHGDFINGIIS